MPIQCAEGQTSTPAKLAASHAAADELCHQLFELPLAYGDRHHQLLSIIIELLTTLC
jgi:hypothetical protein